MLGLYLALIAVWMWTVLVLADRRHMRGILLLPLVVPTITALAIIQSLADSAYDWVTDAYEWVVDLDL